MELAAEGFVEHEGHPGLRTWWGVVGDGEDPGRAPVLTVHGGPGICHDCLEPLAALARGRRVFFYDQLGCGRSDRASDPETYDVDLFVAEFAAVRRSLGLGRVHVLAHSYGGPLVLEHLLRSRGDEAASLVLSNSFASVPALAAGWARLRADLPAAARAALEEADRTGETEAEVYAAALGEFIGRHVLPFAPPEPLQRSQAGSGAEVYARMHGSSWFSPDGQWAGWDVTDRLDELRLPTLVVGGVRDQCVPELAERIAAGVPGAELAVLDTAHLPFFERPGEWLDLVAGFLDRVETRATATAP